MKTISYKDQFFFTKPSEAVEKLTPRQHKVCPGTVQLKICEVPCTPPQPDAFAPSRNILPRIVPRGCGAGELEW